MSSKFKKYFFIVIIIGLTYGAYWFFFSAHWGVAIDTEHNWKFSFQPKETTSFNDLNWENPEEKNALLEENRDRTLVFQTEFNLKDYTKILEGVIEYEFRYSTKILINGVECADINRNVISSSLERDKIKIYAYWKNRKVKLNHAFLNSHLKNGKNTITLIVYNVEDVKSVECAKKQLYFLTKGRKNSLKPNFKLEKPSRSFSKSKLPIFKINTGINFIPDDPKITASLDVIDNLVGINRLLDSSTFYNIKIERRGKTSQTFAKKSYGFNVYDQNNKKKATALLNLPSSKKWVLYGPYADKSLIRNALAYSIYTKMGNYAPRTQFIELVINNNYQGIYLLTEKIQIGPNHLDIPKLKENENDSAKFNGGYLLEVDRNRWRSIYPPKEDTSAYPTSYIAYSPKTKKISPHVQEIIKSQYNVFEQHIYENDNMYDYFDINSFVDYLIITEVTKNVDGYCLSTFLYNKNINDKTPKFYIGPIWDYNFSMGLTDYRQGFNPEGYVYNSTRYIPFWWEKLLNDEKFSSTLKSRYFYLRKTALSDQSINSSIDSLYKICESSNELNFKKWPVLNSQEFWPNYYLGKTYKDEVNYLKSWLNKRLHFLDNDILAKEKKGVNYYEISIRNNNKWMKEIKLKAKERNISIDEMIKIDAKYMVKKE